MKENKITTEKNYKIVAWLISVIGIILIFLLPFTLLQTIEKPKEINTNKNIFLIECVNECSDYIHFKIMKEEDVQVAILKYQNGTIHSVYCNCNNQFEKRIW